MIDHTAEASTGKIVKDTGFFSILRTIITLMLKWAWILIKSVNNRQINKTEKFYDMVAINYRPEPVTIKTLENAKKYLKVNDNILDFGCADGTVSIEIAGSVKQVCGIDISQKMIDSAKRNSTESKILNGYFLQATIFDDRFKKESFDVILAFSILHVFEDGKDVIQRISELLKPGGLLISLTPCMGEKKTFLGIILSYLMKIRVFPYIRFFKVSELEDLLITWGSFQNVVVENYSADGQTLLFSVARKPERKYYSLNH